MRSRASNALVRMLGLIWEGVRRINRGLGKLVRELKAIRFEMATRDELRATREELAAVRAQLDRIENGQAKNDE